MSFRIKSPHQSLRRAHKAAEGMFWPSSRMPVRILGVAMRAAAAETAVDIIGLVAITFGVFWIWGVGWAAIVGGLLVVGVSLWRALR